MRTFKALIIEDEVGAIRTLQSFIRDYQPRIIVDQVCQSIAESLFYLENNSVDILFVDVQLEDGKGTDLLNKIDTSKYKIVFTTAYEEYALTAFKHKAFGYLLKPLNPKEFKEISMRVINDLESNSDWELSREITLPVANGQTWIKLSDLVRCQSENNYTRFITKDGTFLISRTLKYVENEMIYSTQFLRVHQSHLINVNYLQSNTIVENCITLTNGDKVPVSRAKRSLFFNR